MSLLSGTVLVTGASGGIGEAIARAVAPQRGDLVLSGRRREAVEPLARELGARVAIAELSQREEVDRLAAEVGDVDVLIANAGLLSGGLLTDFSQAQIDELLEVNLRAPIALARALTPGMAARRRGHVVFISSLQGKAATPVSSIYCAAKFGLRGFALALREDLRGDGVGVSVVLPGFIRDAGMFADAHVTLPPGVGTRSPQDVAEGVISAIERDRAEVEVAPLPLRLGTAVASVAPALSAAVSRRLGSDQIAARIVAGQRQNR